MKKLLQSQSFYKRSSKPVNNARCLVKDDSKAQLRYKKVFKRTFYSNGMPFVKMSVPKCLSSLL